MKRRLVGFGSLASGGIAAVVAYRRWLGDRRERIDVYFEDGSFVTFSGGSTEGERLLPLARDVLSAAQRQ